MRRENRNGDTMRMEKNEKEEEESTASEPKRTMTVEMCKIMGKNVASAVGASPGRQASRQTQTAVVEIYKEIQMQTNRRKWN